MENKECKRCKRLLAIESFCLKRRNKDGRSERCRECSQVLHKGHYENNKQDYLEKNKQRRLELRQWFLDLKSKLQCEICGENHPATLDFHHRNPEEKDFDVSRLMRFGSKQRILAEIEKCNVWCSNCHRKHHWQQ